MNVRRAVREAIVAAQTVCAQSYMSYCICSFCRGKSHPKFSYLRKSLRSLSFCVFMDRDDVEVHKNARRKRGRYPAILTELVWSIKDLLYGIKSTEKNDLRTCLFSSTEKETI